MISQNEVEGKTATPEQSARANLREGFLRAVSELCGEPCKMLTYEHSSLHATFTSWKPDGSEILVNNLQTPTFNMPSALLRTSDILAVHFERPIQLP